VGAAAAAGTYIILRLALAFAFNRLGKFAARSPTQVDDGLVEVLSGTSQWLIALFALLVGAGMLDLSDRWANRVGQLWFVALALQAALWGTRAIAILLRRYIARHQLSDTGHLGATATLMSWGLRTALWTIVLLAILSNLGVNVSALVASLGVGGVAVALAVQNILGDLFASLSIAIDKPFEVGDFVTVGSASGTIEHVGLKSTRIRSLGGEQIVMSNTDLLKQTISNYKLLQERRVVFGFGVTYDTSVQQARMIPGAVERIVKASSHLRFDRAHLTRFGESSLDYEVVYYVLSSDYTLYMDEQQRINLELMQALGKMGVSFAFPTRTIVLAQDGMAQPLEAYRGSQARH
jgi:small-conductance mechanosensitive channel